MQPEKPGVQGHRFPCCFGHTDTGHDIAGHEGAHGGLSTQTTDTFQISVGES